MSLVLKMNGLFRWADVSSEDGFCVSIGEDLALGEQRFWHARESGPLPGLECRLLGVKQTCRRMILTSACSRGC